MSSQILSKSLHHWPASQPFYLLFPDGLTKAAQARLELILALNLQILLPQTFKL